MADKAKIAISELTKYDLFLHKRQVWRTLGKLLPDSHSVTAQMVATVEDGTEVCLENADFTEHLLVEPYQGELPCYGRIYPPPSISDYERSKFK